jgi:phosphatidylglycerol:prolipoprotein diacylglycerol transferase
MLTYPEIDPVAIAIGPLKIHWYGLMYLIGFAGAWWLMRLRAQAPKSGWSTEQVDDLLFYGALGVVAGGRVGYMLFYDFGALVENPLSLFFVWQGGMSFHGGLLGVLVALWAYARRETRSWLAVVDFVAPVVPIGLAAGRLGNFINGELWGKVSDVPWAMAFPSGGPEPRHPSQLYEFALEGVVLFLILWFYSRAPRPVGAVAGMFGLFYGAFRFLVEFVRMPDAHIGYLAFGWLTLGQVLSLPLILAGLYLLWAAYRQPARQPG